MCRLFVTQGLSLNNANILFIINKLYIITILLQYNKKTENKRKICVTNTMLFQYRTQ